MELEEPKAQIVCADCGKVLDEDDIDFHNINGDIVCEDCFNDKYFYCQRCERVESLESCHTIYTNSRDHEYWCQDCMENYSFRCDCCDDRYSEEDVDNYETASGGLICDYCRDDYYRCEDCGRMVHCDDVYYLGEDDDYGYCYNCYQNHQGDRFETVMGYHDRPPMEYYYGDGEEPTRPFKGFGIELEVDEGNIDRNDMAMELHQIVGEHLYYNRDGSLGSNGFEIITMPHTEKALYEIDWEEVLRQLVGNGFTSHNNKRCGLHMHISRAFFGDTEQERTDNIAKMVMFYEIFWNDIRRFSRRTEQQVNSWATRYCGGETPTEDRCKSIVGTRGHGRYRAVNLNNYDTVEFRIMRGSLKYSTFMATLDFLITTAKNSKYIDWASINDQSQWLHGIKDGTVEYMRLRNCFGYTNNQENNDEVEDDGLH